MIEKKFFAGMLGTEKHNWVKASNSKTLFLIKH